MSNFLYALLMLAQSLLYSQTHASFTLHLIPPQLSELLLTTLYSTHLFTTPISLHFSDEPMLNLADS
ncbi:hypothetical protein [Providencia huaxiensis]|uniref:hypothetical protein n=1 Tax=Providencia huaxiensis TaxID=2027290 RepID=UPI0034DD92B9